MTDRKIHLSILTPENTVYENDVDEVFVPTKDGRIGVLPMHVGLVSLIHEGVIKVYLDNKEEEIAVHKGVLEVRKNSQVIILADSAEHVSDMNVEEIEKAKARVEKIMKDYQNKDDVAFARFEDLLAREISRLKVARKHKAR